MTTVAGPSFYNACWMALCRREARAFRHAAQDVQAAQSRVLRQILSANRHSWFGIQHDFERVKTLSDYQHATPLSSYDDYRPSIVRICSGEHGVLTTERVNLLEPTGGSTTGAKLIPYTAGLRRAFQRAVRTWIWDLFSSRPAVRRGTAYWSISPLGTARQPTSGGVPIGFDDDSAYLGALERRLVQRTMAVPPDVALSTTVESCLYATLIHLLRRPSLSLISVWSPTFLSQMLAELWRRRDSLCRDVETGRTSFDDDSAGKGVDDTSFAPQPNRATELRDIFASAAGISECIRNIWPNLSLVSCWTDGPSAPYANQLRQQLDGIELQPKGLLATEAAISIPLVSQPAAALAVRSHFFEFLPPSPSTSETLLAHELEVGQQYRVVVTTQGGLYRYQMHDQVEVVGRYGEAPLIRFTGKTDATSDLVGEKLNAAQVQSAMQTAFNALGISPQFAQLEAQRQPPGYVLHVCEPALETNPTLAGQLCQLMQDQLRANPTYQFAVEMGQLAPLRVEAVSRENAQRYVEHHISQKVDDGQRWGDVKMSTLTAALPTAHVLSPQG